MRRALERFRRNQAGSVLTTVVTAACMLGLVGLFAALMATTLRTDHRVIQSIDGVTVEEGVGE